MTVTAIDFGGHLRSVQLSKLECAEGECHGNWWLAGFLIDYAEYEKNNNEEIPENNTNDDTGGTTDRSDWCAVFPPSVISSADRTFKVMCTNDSIDCVVANSIITVPADSDTTFCSNYTTNKKNGLSMQVFRYQKESDLGWPDGSNYIRIKNSKYAEEFGAWEQLSSWGGGLYPYFVIQHDTATYILFGASEGIRGPAHEMRMLARVDGNKLLFGRMFSAGGQPCD